MGEMVDVGPVVDSKNSPRHSAIEKAQAELRQEYYVREERKRELEFLEKGGNPLDFKAGPMSSASVQSTSVTEQLHDYDAKASSAAANSTHEESENSCIRPVSTLGKESTTADNLLLIESQQSNLDGSKSELRPGKRKTAPVAEQPPKKETTNIRDSDDSGSFRFGVKSQAYARRNRSRPNRESLGVPSARSAPSSTSNKSSALPSLCADNEEKKEPVVEVKERNGNTNSLEKSVTDRTQVEAGPPEVDARKMNEAETPGDQPQKGDEDSKAPKASEISPPISDSIVREPASSRPDENPDKSESVSNDNQANKRVEVLNGIAQVSSDMNTHDVSSHVMESSAILEKDMSVAEKRDSEAVGVKLFTNPELLKSDIQVKIEETCESEKNSLGSGNRVLNQNKEKDFDSTLDGSNCNATDLKVGLETLDITAVNNSSATVDLLTQHSFPEKALEDAILKEARLIEAKMRRVNKLSSCNFPAEKHRKSHWDYLLEEMAWLANDFIQERKWKIVAASQMSHQVAWAACHEWGNSKKQREIARILAKSVSSFWNLAESYQSNPNINDKEFKSILFLPMQRKRQETSHKQDDVTFEDEHCTKAADIPILDYAMKFLGSNSIDHHHMIAEAPVTPERTCDSGVLGMQWETQYCQESLFYDIPPGAMKVYRESIESRWLHHENTSNVLHHDDFNSLAEFHEDEVEAHYFSGKLERSKSSKFSHKRKKFFQDKNLSARSYDGRPDLSYGSRLANQPSLMSERRGPGTFNGSSIPTKRMRTASRQRIVSPFGVGNSSQPMNSKTDASSGDTSSFQDDHAYLHGESMARRNADTESTADFERSLVFSGSDPSMRFKKKKKQRLMGYRNLNSPDGFGISKASSYDHRWQAEASGQLDKRDLLKKRLDGHHFDSFGSTGVHGQHVGKKPKLLRHMPDTSPDSMNPISGSHPSPAASQISSMPNTNKLIKLITSRDRNRKGKGLKMIGGQLSTGGSWTQFEDQALVVLVHDMGTNWELVSDTINSTLKFKCIFRTPNECKERHKVLMERSAGDGADSAEDSGSSQSYPSTLPGIPKGSARQLFQRLQGPMEEDTLKSHLEKIIVIGRHQHFRQVKSESKETKLISQVHSSHFHAVSQACPSSVNGLPLTPLDLAEVSQSSESPGQLGFQNSQPATSPARVHPSLSPSMMPSSGMSSILSGSSGHAIGSGLSSPASSIGNTRDPRYASPRASFPLDEQQRVQQYSPLISSRSSLQQPGMSGPGALTMGVDRGVRMLSGGSSMGMFSSGNNGLPGSPRHGFQGIGSPAVLNTVMPNSVTGQANSLLRPRAPQNVEDHKPMMMPDVQLPTAQPGVPIGSISSPGPGPGSVTAAPMQSHVFSGNALHHPGHQTYAMRLAKERQQLQQRHLHQQPHFSPTNPGLPAQRTRPPGNPRQPVGPLNPRHPLPQTQNMPPRHHQQLQPPQRFSSPAGLFSGSGPQKMYPRPQSTTRPVGPSGLPQQPQQPVNPSQQAMQRILLQQNSHLAVPSEGAAPAGPPIDQAQVNPASGPGPEVGPAWKPEASPQKQDQGLTKRTFSGAQWQQQKLTQQLPPSQDQSPPPPAQHSRQVPQSGPSGQAANPKPA